MVGQDSFAGGRLPACAGGCPGSLARPGANRPGAPDRGDRGASGGPAELGARRRSLPRCFLPAVCIGITAAALACGGTGGPDDPDPLLYEGATDPVALDRDNSQELLGVLWGTPATDVRFALEPGPPRSRSAMAALIGRSLLAPGASAGTAAAAGIPAAVDVDERVPCPDGGLLLLNGRATSPQEFIGRFEWRSCDQGLGFVADGVAHVETRRIVGAALVDGDIDVVRLRFEGPLFDSTFSGPMTIDSDPLDSSIEVLIYHDVVFLDNPSGQMFRFTDFVFETDFDNRFSASRRALTFSAAGSWFVSTHGLVGVDTTTPLTCNFCTPGPDGGGPLEITGAANSFARATPQDSASFLLEVDADGDGDPETSLSVAWQDILP